MNHATLHWSFHWQAMVMQWICMFSPSSNEYYFLKHIKNYLLFNLCSLKYYKNSNQSDFCSRFKNRDLPHLLMRISFKRFGVSLFICCEWIMVLMNNQIRILLKLLLLLLVQVVTFYMPCFHFFPFLSEKEKNNIHHFQYLVITICIMTCTIL